MGSRGSVRLEELQTIQVKPREVAGELQRLSEEN